MPLIAEIDKNIWNYLYNNTIKQDRRYIGASNLGHICDRKIWLDWKGKVNSQGLRSIDEFGKKQEIFKRGHQFEDEFIQKLQDAGYIVFNRQNEFEDKELDLKGHCDGFIYDENNQPLILEIKTSKETSFNRVKKHGIKKIYPQYISQVQLYMHYFKIYKCLMIFINKNVDYDRYYEIIEYDANEVEGLLGKAKRIKSYDDQMPAAIGDLENPHFICKMCDYYNFCYTGLNGAET